MVRFQCGRLIGPAFWSHCPASNRFSGFGRHRHCVGGCRDLSRFFTLGADAIIGDDLPRLWLQISQRGRSSGHDRAVWRNTGGGQRFGGGERRAIGTAGAWFDRRVGPAAGTKGHVAHANRVYMFDKRQLDCVDSSRNTTSLLLMFVAQFAALPRCGGAGGARLYFHAPAPCHRRAARTATGKEWSVDSWTRAYGQAPEIMPLSRWKTLD